MKNRFWTGDNGVKRKPKARWASMRSGYPDDGGKIVFRWGEEHSANQKVVISEDMAEMLARQWIKDNFKEIPQG